MGASASVMSDENFVMMSKDLKEEYDTLIEAGYTDDEIRAQLMEKFNAFTTANQNDSADPESSERIDDNESINAETDGEVDKPLDSNGLVIANNAPFKLGEKEKVGLGNNKDEAPVGSVKGKKTRKRRGTFENDAVVTTKPDSSKANPVGEAVVVDEVVEEGSEDPVVEI
eukprot:CAMPEP_0119043538 /NCGR_PEP_ID=MMETSP1177-20130426/23189_1 /TAXON_ID=2985 /ORGANISM="Ochromonas sp, Strain CCMP1899" /LENGTH=169 /DNA_ID=CAMNT_0007011847 /DNA_START=57 /DNA_END=566 /DNA_ORIENTATION=+